MISVHRVSQIHLLADGSGADCTRRNVRRMGKLTGKDFLDELIEWRTAKTPEFGRLVEKAAARRGLQEVSLDYRPARLQSETATHS
jgi:hypothetical protein